VYGIQCSNCYARRMAKRLAGRFGYPKDDPFKVTLHHNRLFEPGNWNNPRKVFVCSMGDLFHEDVPDDFVMSVFGRMEDYAHHTYLVLTKRPERMAKLVHSVSPHIWLGVSVENQRRADERIPVLLNTPAKVKFVSCEPLLGPVDLSSFLSSLDWVIVGGESGYNARPKHPAWVRKLRDKCVEAGVPFFFKQWGEWSRYRCHCCS